MALVATVVPSFTLPTSGNITPEILQRLASPLVYITGTIDSTSLGVGSVTDTNVSATAAISLSKLAAVTANRLLVSDNSGVMSVAVVAGDATASSASGTFTITLANSGVAAGSYGSATTIPVLTIDAKGRVTACSTTALTVAIASVTATGTSGQVAETNGSVLGLVTTRYVSGNLTIPSAGSSVSASHGLGAVPSAVRVVVRVAVANNGYTVGQEINLENFIEFATGPLFSYTVSSSAVDIVRGVTTNNLYARNATGTFVDVTTSFTTNFQLKVYCYK